MWIAWQWRHFFSGDDGSCGQPHRFQSTESREIQGKQGQITNPEERHLLDSDESNSGSATGGLRRELWASEYRDFEV